MTIRSILNKIPLHMGRVGQDQSLSIPSETRAEGMGQMKRQSWHMDWRRCSSSRDLKKQEDPLLLLKWFK